MSGITPADQAKIIKDLATAVKIVLELRLGELAALDARAVAMAFAVNAGAIVKASGGTYVDFTNMTSSAWNNEMIKQLVIAQLAPRRT